jgi:transcriptional regulator with XRE-family HTH domain
MHFSEKITLLRNNAGYSQELLAEKLNISRQSVSKWELGITLPDTEKIIAISDLFNVSIDFLLKESSVAHNSDDLDRVVFKFLGSAQEIDSISKSLIDIMQDGVIDQKEQGQMTEIISTLDNLTRIINEIKLRIKT